MGQNCFHASIEGAQHGAKSLDAFLKWAKESGRRRAAFQLHAAVGQWLQERQGDQRCVCQKAIAYGRYFGALPVLGAHDGMDGQSDDPAVHSGGCGGEITRADRAMGRGLHPMRLFDLAAELGIKIMPMFWGVAFGWEVATGYPWGFWSGGDFDFIKEGKERFVKKTAKIRAQANKLGIYLAHEIHPGTGGDVRR
jgi:hypothetical protein